MSEIEDIWVYLATEPLLWLTVTLAVYALAFRVSVLSGNHPLVNPVVLSALVLVTILHVSETPFETYFSGAQFIHFMLGPATVALAVPLVRNAKEVRRRLPAIVCALAAGSVTAVVSVIAVAKLLGAPADVIVSLAPKSATMPIAMSLSESLGGIPALTAALVVTTGILGAIIVTPLMNALRIRDYAARGFAVGLTSHGIGTARAFTVDQTAGLFAGIALGLNSLMTVFVVPLVVDLLG